MRRYSLTIFDALLLILFHSSVHTSCAEEAQCIEREREALINFKHSLSDPYGLLSTWNDDGNNTDCCKWRGIQCNNLTAHVQLLHLRGGDTDTGFLYGPINLTSLFDLHNIQHLDLSNNVFEWSHIPEELIASFTHLTYLNLSFSFFGGRIPSAIGNLSQLRHLDLRGNYLQGEIPFQIGNLRQLQYLDLGDNYLSGEIPMQIGNLKQLRYLNLKENDMSGAIPFQTGYLPLLHTLRLGDNFHIQAKDADWLSNLSSLTNLEFSSLPNLKASPHFLQTVTKFIPNLLELRLVDCSLSDADVKSLFKHSHSNFSTSLTILDLSSNLLTSSTFHFLSSLFPNFPSLQLLDLSYNNLTSSMFHGNLNFGSKLTELHLRNCSLTDSSFLVSSTSTINSSSSLLYLDLSSNLLKSSAVFYSLFNYTTNLRTLYINENMLEGPIPHGFGKAMNSLEYLYLYYNKLQGDLPSFFGNMCRLQSLHLSKNKLNGEISNLFQNSTWCNRHVFHTLHLSENQITGMIPKSIRLLSELELLYLDANSLEGDVTESHLSNLSKLKTLFLSYNSLSVKFDPSWIPPFRLISLGVASCKLGPSFPASWLQTQSSLTYLDISNNGLNDIVPDWFWNNLQSISWLNMSHNKLFGEIANIPLKLSPKPYINMVSNQFEGKVPSFLLQASQLFLSKNKFSDLISFLCDQSKTASMATLDLSNNHLKGQLPDCWKSVNQLLLFLDLRNNKLSGKIPTSMGTLFKLETLVLGNNNLMGELPPTLKSCSNLVELDVGENMLSGPIPYWIGENMRQLTILIMRGNHFSGNIPIQLCYLRHIQLLDLSRNKLSKGISACIKNFTAMSERSINRSETQSRIHWNNVTYYEIYSYHLDYYRLNVSWMWKGVEQGFPNPEMRLKSIDLSSNSLEGHIPKEFGYLVGLNSLNLSRNNLSGEIPFEIGNLSSLEFLDLSRNHLCGEIPPSLTQIDGLGKLNLSHNSLSGRIPLGRHFQTYDASSFEANNDLCGEQLNKSCPENQTSVKSPEPAVHGEDSVFCGALYMSMGLGYFTGFWGLIGPILIWKPWRIAYLRFLNRFTNWLCLICLMEDGLRKRSASRIPEFLHDWSVSVSESESHYIDLVQTYRNDPGQPLVTAPFGHASQEIVNLLLSGQAVPNVFDGRMDLGGGMFLKGTSQFVEVGFLTLLESLGFCKDGHYLKCPKWPIWVVGSESHYTVLFALYTSVQNENEPEERESQIRKAFDAQDQSGGGGFISVDGFHQVLRETNIKLPQEKLEHLCSTGFIVWSEFWQVILDLDKSLGGLKDSSGLMGKKVFDLYHFNGIAKSDLNSSQVINRSETPLQRPRLTKLRVSVPSRWTPEEFMADVTVSSVSIANESSEKDSEVIKSEPSQHAPLVDCIRTRWPRAVCSWSGDPSSIV
ncbi:hypothetical protein Fmac_016108 [Flemingia macrophylla]|uniref:Deubiquitinating enzyme MINDY-3/4 conserved domain-containing protein n=1 Tax=Flemingia macrophylla TaxID=520843 RepID=A0ABD1MIL7_9FABA